MPAVSVNTIRPPVIVLTTYDTDDEISQALKAGAKAYVLKDIAAEQLLLACIRDVLAGKTYIAPAAAQARRDRHARPADAPRAFGAPAAGRRQGQQGDRQRAGYQRADREDPPGAPVREAGRHEPHGKVKVATRRGLVRLQ